ncbi:MAG: class I SAM-dependent methyltransferase [Anaerolineae bacterium]|nr:class I SAM-dependent methyltransferase [Anaerolineae bacterium]
MTIQSRYDEWSKTYDTDENFTRDLDEVVTKNILLELSCDIILEIGCGTGKNTNLLSKIAKTTYALDFSQSMLTKAKSRVQADNVTFGIADLTNEWPIGNQSVDLVVCNLVLEHIEDLHFVFGEVTRVLAEKGKFFISELHPFKQYQGIRANFQQAGKTTEIQAFIHHISDFIDAANESGLKLLELNEWWHENDQGKPPRLLTLMFEKNTV